MKRVRVPLVAQVAMPGDTEALAETLIASYAERASQRDRTSRTGHLLMAPGQDFGSKPVRRKPRGALS